MWWVCLSYPLPRYPAHRQFVCCLLLICVFPEKPFIAMAAKGSASETFPDLHHKMSKKIAQLTKVIYHLNTRNEDHQVDYVLPSPDNHGTDGLLRYIGRCRRPECQSSGGGASHPQRRRCQARQIQRCHREPTTTGIFIPGISFAAVIHKT